MTIETVTLPSGQEEVKPLALMLQNVILPDLMRTDPIAFYEFVMLCRDAKHPLWSEAITAKLKDRHLVESNGQPHDSARAIVNWLVEGNDFEMRITKKM